MKRYIPAEEKNIRILGRTKVATPLPLFWTAAGVEFWTNGNELAFEFESDYSIYQEWIRVEVNDYSLIRMPLEKGVSIVKVFSGFASEEPKHIRLYKEVQAMDADNSAKLLLNAVLTDGELLPLQQNEYKLEVIGDSITSGEGLAGSQDTFAWNSFIFSTDGHYAVKLAKQLKAELSIVSQSGWGTYCAWDNRPGGAMPKVYDRICGPISNTVNKAYGCDEKYDFEKNAADIVVINLGTNDDGAFHSPAYTDEAGNVYEQKLMPDGSYEKESIDRTKKAMYDFLVEVRSKNPNALIVWTYGMIGNPMEPTIKEVVAKYVSDVRDKKAFYCPVPNTEGEAVGANGHPGRSSHANAAKVLAEFIKEHIK